MNSPNRGSQWHFEGLWTFSLVPNCWFKGLWCPAAPANRDHLALFLFQMPKDISGGITSYQDLMWNHTDSKEVVHGLWGDDWMLAWPPIDSSLWDQGSLCQIPLCAQARHHQPGPDIPRDKPAQWSKSDLKVSRLLPASCTIQEGIFFWCSMTDPLIKTVQTWTWNWPYWRMSQLFPSCTAWIMHGIRDMIK